MTMPHDNPALAGRPIVLQHYEDRPGSGLTACSGQQFETRAAECFPQIPRVLCSLCQARSLGVGIPPEVTRIDLVELQPGDTIIATVPDHTDQQTADRIKLVLRRELGPQHRICVKTRSVEIEVQRDATEPDAS